MTEHEILRRLADLRTRPAREAWRPMSLRGRFTPISIVLARILRACAAS